MIDNIQLYSYLEKLLGDRMRFFLESPPEFRSIRVNALKTSLGIFEKWSRQHNLELLKIPFTPMGYKINNDFIPLSHTLPFFKGYFQYQGISSQIPVILLDVKPGLRILDMTAAPGSKSSQLAVAMHNSGELVLNDLSRKRLPKTV